MKTARVIEGRIVEIITLPEGTGLEDAFHQDFVSSCKQVADEAEVGWIEENGEWVPVVPVGVDLISFAADLRWRKEVGGIEVAGIPIATDDRSKLMITGARMAALADPNWSTAWHGADGNTYPLDAATIVTISDAVLGHVNGTFATFAAVKAGVAAGEIASEAEVEAFFA